jgi:HEAT repeats
MRRPSRLTAAVHRLVALDRHHRPSIGRLTAAQVRTLAQVARRPQAFEERVSAPRAIEALARGAKVDAAIRVLARIVGEQGASIPTRITAARELGFVANAGAERALLRRADVEHPRVQQAVLRALGAIGSPAALRALARLREPADPAVRRQLVFARALIAHRHGLEGVSLPPIDGETRRPEQVGDRTTLTSTMANAAATAKNRERLTGSVYGIDLAGRAAKLVCGRAEWTVFFNRDVEPSQMATRLRERPWVLGLMAGWHGERRMAIVKHVILTTPDGNGAHVDIVRRDGARIYTGRMTADGAKVRFTLTDVDRPATAPTYVSGHVSARGSPQSLRGL